MNKLKVAFVVQRFGKEVNGGSEELCRKIAERMSSFWDIDVLTSCSKSYRLRFENEFDAGTEKIGLITIKRFITNELRPLDPSFTDLDNKVLKREATRDEEDQWLRWVGPYSQDLYDYIKQNSGTYQLFIFFTYLYATTTVYLPLVREKSILIPTAHDEPPIYARYFDRFFDLPRHIFFCTDEERSFLQKRIGRDLPNSSTVSLGIDFPLFPDLQTSCFADKLPKRFCLYLGRIQREKGVPDLIENYKKMPESFRKEFPLILVGQMNAPIELTEDMLHLGFISEEEKHIVLSNCTVLIMPSKYESLSLSVLEAWAYKKPVLVNGESEVLVGHCHKSNGGLFYKDSNEFVVKLLSLTSDGSEQQRAVLGRNGYSYVEKNYTWDRVKDKYLKTADNIVRPASAWDRLLNYLTTLLRPTSAAQRNRFRSIP